MCSVLAIFNSSTMDTSGLPDIYTRSPRAAGPRAEGVYIRQIPSAHGITDICHVTLMLLNSIPQVKDLRPTINIAWVLQGSISKL